MADTTPADRAATATELAIVLRIPAGTVRRYIAEGAIQPIGRRGRYPLYDGREVAAERHRRRVVMGVVDA